MNIRKLVKARLKEKDRTRYWLAHEVSTCHWTTVYRWLRGDRRLNDDAVGEILGILDLDIRPVRKRR